VQLTDTAFQAELFGHMQIPLIMVCVELEGQVAHVAVDEQVAHESWHGWQIKLASE